MNGEVKFLGKLFFFYFIFFFYFFFFLGGGGLVGGSCWGGGQGGCDRRSEAFVKIQKQWGSGRGVG